MTAYGKHGKAHVVVEDDGRQNGQIINPTRAWQGIQGQLPRRCLFHLSFHALLDLPPNIIIIPTTYLPIYPCMDGILFLGLRCIYHGGCEKKHLGFV